MSSLNKFLAVVGGCVVGYKAYSSFSLKAETTKEDNHGLKSSNVISSSGIQNLEHLMHDKKKRDSNNSSSRVQLNRSQVRSKCKKAIRESKSLVSRFMTEKNIPGLVIGVSFRGQDVWVKGFGFSNLELANKCTPETVMRIASISKSVTMLLVAKLLEEGKLDLDKSIYSYLKPEQFPHKKWDGKPTDITLRQLVSHLGGIRHYKMPNDNGSNTSEFDQKEYYLRQSFADVYEALTLFKDDDLISAPGTAFNYTTHGFTLISAVVQSVLPSGEDFGNFLVKRILRQDLGMYNTFLDQNDPLIRDRANYYFLNKNHVLTNAPFVDNSYKYAGGGLLSSIPDLLTFGRVMMYSFLGGIPGVPASSGYLKRETVDQMWTPAAVQGKTFYSNKFSRFFSYGMGWAVLRTNSPTVSKAACSPPPFSTAAYHAGGAVGASSAILILPEEEVVVAVFCNLQEVNLLDLSCSVAQKFISRLYPDKKFGYLTFTAENDHEVITTEV